MRGYLDQHFVLTSNIDLGVAPYNQGAGWEPIGTSAAPFTGGFDGGGFAITGLTIDRSSTDYVGLFGRSDGEIENVGLANVSVSGGGYVGGLVGALFGTITNSYSTGSVTGGSNKNFVGGLVGLSDGATITNSYSAGAVNGGSFVGGLVGSSSSSTITNSYSAGTISGSGSQVGGLVGRAVNATVTDSFWDTQTSGQASSAAGTGKTTAEMTTRATFTDAAWDFSGSGGTDPVWGIAGNFNGGYPYLYALSNDDVPAPFAAGSGTTADPYQISTAAELNTVRGYLDQHFVLTSNLDLGVAPYNQGAGWEPIGTSAAPFTGGFDGGGFAITGLTIDRSSTDYVGLFGRSDGEIENVGLANVSVSGGDYVGGLVGALFGTITNSYSSGSASGNSLVGGLVGVSNSGTVTNSYSSGSVTGGQFVGGLVGLSGGTITNSYSSGSVTSSSSLVGGLVGDNRGTITSSYSSGSVTGNSNVGGLVGANSNGGTVTNSFWDTQTSGQTSSAAGTGKTTAEMTTRATFTDAGWDFSGSGGTDPVWGIAGNFNGGYPYLYALSNDDAPPFAAGSGTAADPYQIATAAELSAVRGYLDQHFVLTSGFALGVAPYNQGAGWEPIGTIAAPFTGSFDGGGFTITGLTINRSSSDVGLFGVASGSISNVGLANVSVSGDTRVGGLVGENRGTVTSSYISGSVSGDDRIGGLVGYSFGGTITNSYSSGSVTGDGFAGGLVGYNRGTVTSSYSTGSVTGNSNVGGLMGANQDATVTNSYSSGSVSGNSSVGGLVGASIFSTVTNSFWDTQTSGQTTSAAGTGKTTAEMTTLSTFTDAGWDFSASDGNAPVWDIAGNLNSGYPYLPGLPADAALPVELTSFDALADGTAAIVLEWETASETNNAGFEVQHHTGGSWQALAFVEGAGTTGEARQYEHRALGLLPGTHAFRLRQIDYDGAEEFSAQIEVLLGMDEALALQPVAPNPLVGRATVRFSAREAGPVVLEAYDMMGRHVATLFRGEVAASETQQVAWDAGRLSAGVYVLRLSSIGDVRMQTVTVLR